MGIDINKMFKQFYSLTSNDTVSKMLGVFYDLYPRQSYDNVKNHEAVGFLKATSLFADVDDLKRIGELIDLHNDRIKSNTINKIVIKDESEKEITKEQEEALILDLLNNFNIRYNISSYKNEPHSIQRAIGYLQACRFIVRSLEYKSTITNLIKTLNVAWIHHL